MVVVSSGGNLAMPEPIADQIIAVPIGYFQKFMTNDMVGLIVEPSNIVQKSGKQGRI